MRYIFILLALIMFNLLSCQPAFCDGVSNVQMELRGYDEVTLPEGTFIPVMTTQEISTETCPEGYKVKFVATNDLYMYETNIIPRGTEFYGYIEKINEPVIGTNSSMKIKIIKLVMKDGFEIPIKGYLYSSNDNVIGGELTPPAKWEKVPHYQSRFQGISWNHRAATLQMRPGGTRTMGIHTRIPAGDQQIVVLVAPTSITHIFNE
jgi:hypothetical protein